MKPINILLSSLSLMACLICSTSFAENIVAPADFLDKATARDITEIETGKLALQNAKRPEVIAYAQHMIAEHSANNKELVKLAEQKNIPLRNETELANNIRAFVARQIDEKSFDIAYAKNQVLTHQRTVQLFRHAIVSDDQEVRAFAKAMLPKLMHHLYMAQQLLEATSTPT